MPFNGGKEVQRQMMGQRWLPVFETHTLLSIYYEKENAVLNDDDEEIAA